MSTLRILVIEDSDAKFADIVATLHKEFGELLDPISRATNFYDASSVLKSSHFDLVILDIRFPTTAYSPRASRENSESIVEIVTNGAAIIPSHIIGLTEYPEELERAGEFPIEYFAIEKYSSTDSEWKGRIIRHVRYILNSKMASVNIHYNSFDFDLVIMVARAKNEFDPICDSINWEEGTKREEGLFDTCRTVTGVWNLRDGTTIKVAVICIMRAGLSSAGAACSAAQSYYRPRVVAMLGMCCGLNKSDSAEKQELGDVVIMNETCCWDEGRYTEKKADAGATPVSSDEDVSDEEIEFFFENRPASQHISKQMKKCAEYIIEAKAHKICQRLKDEYERHPSGVEILDAGNKIPESPKIRIGLNLSGSSVVDARQQSEEIVRRFQSAISLEMECHAIYQAVYLAPGRAAEVVCIKGIADFGSGKKTKEYQKIASIGSLVVCEEVMMEWLKRQKGDS